MNSLFDLINHQASIDEIYLYAKDPYEAKYQLLINKGELQALIMVKLWLIMVNGSKTFIKYSNDKDGIKKILKNAIEITNMILILWYDPTIVTELFIRGGKLNIYLVFIAQSYFVVPKNSQLNSTHSIISISNKQKLQ